MNAPFNPFAHAYPDEWRQMLVERGMANTMARRAEKAAQQTPKPRQTTQPARGARNVKPKSTTQNRNRLRLALAGV